MYKLGEVIPGVRDLCGICLDPMCGNHNPSLGTSYNPTNFQHLRINWVDPSNDTITNPCTYHFFQPSEVLQPVQNAIMLFQFSFQIKLVQFPFLPQLLGGR